MKLYFKKNFDDKNKIINYFIQHYKFIFEEDFEIIKSIKDVEDGSTIYIENFEVLGYTSYNIFNKIIKLTSKNINIYIIDKRLTINKKSPLFLNTIESICKIEQKNINNRLNKKRDTMKNKKISGGRWGNKKPKSAFDKHKNFIFKELKSGVSIVNIFNKLKEKNLNVTIQALYHFIKKQKETPSLSKVSMIDPNNKGNIDFNPLKTLN